MVTQKYLYPLLTKKATVDLVIDKNLKTDITKSTIPEGQRTKSSISQGHDLKDEGDLKIERKG